MSEKNRKQNGNRRKEQKFILWIDDGVRYQKKIWISEAEVL